MRITAWVMAGLSLLSVAGHAQGRQNASRSVHGTALIRIDNRLGAVHLTGWDRDSMTVTATTGAADQKLQISGTPDSVNVTIAGHSQATADLELRVPARALLWIRTAHGEIDADQLLGSVTALTESGRLRVGGSVVAAQVESIEGNIELAADATKAVARAGSGTVVFRGSIKSAEASSGSGALLIGLTGPLAQGRFLSVSGPISFKGPLTPDGTLELQTHSGDVELRMPPTLGARYDIGTYGGTIREDLSSKTLRTISDKAVFTIGDGKALVMVRSFKGTASIMRQETLGARE